MKQIVERDYYLTYALTNGEKIYGIEEEHWITDWSREGALYWSEVFVDGNMFNIHRKGTLLTNKTNEQLSELHLKSKVNLHAGSRFKKILVVTPISFDEKNLPVHAGHPSYYSSFETWRGHLYGKMYDEFRGRLEESQEYTDEYMQECWEKNFLPNIVAVEVAANEDNLFSMMFEGRINYYTLHIVNLIVE